MNKEDLKLYLVTDENALNGRDFFEAVEEALKGGVTIVQLREKSLCPDEFLKKAVKLKQLTDKYNVPLIINDKLEIVFDSKAHGLHIGQGDIAIRDGRRIIRKDGNKILGVTANTISLAKEAEEKGADYIGVGAAFATSTKHDAKTINHELIKEITKSVKIPVVAIGGINAENAHLLCGMGLSGIALSSGILGAENIFETAKYIRNLKL